MGFFKTTVWAQIQEAKQRSRSALDDLALRYWEPIRLYVAYRGFADAAEDIAQDVMIQVCDEDFLRDADKSKGRFRTLLHRVTENILSKHIRAQHALKRDASRTVPLPADPMVLAPQDERQYDRIWAVSIMRQALEQLETEHEKQAEAIHLHYYEERPLRMIADRWATTEQVVKNHLHEGRLRLRRLIRARIQAYCSSSAEYREELEQLSGYLP